MVEKTRFTPRAVLARNLKAVMGTKKGPTSQLALAKASGVAQATIGRILREETGASIETVADLAKAYDLEAWQLMVAGMDPTNPPVLQPVSKSERALYERLKLLSKDITDLKM
jgi:transcriptional regulator with XRE-family HTH domain